MDLKTFTDIFRCLIVKCFPQNSNLDGGLLRKAATALEPEPSWKKLGGGTYRSIAAVQAQQKSINHFVCVFKSQDRPNFRSVFSAESKKKKKHN